MRWPLNTKKTWDQLLGYLEDYSRLREQQAQNPKGWNALGVLEVQGDLYG